MDSPLIESLNTLLSKFLLVTLMTLLPSSIEGLIGLWEEQPLSPSFKGLELGNESPPFKWEWFSEPLDCPPDERCKPESMVGMMSPLGGNPRSSGRGGSQHISYSGLVETLHGPEQGLPAWIPITSGNNPTHAHYGWNYVTGPGTYNAYAMVYDLQLYS